MNRIYLDIPCAFPGFAFATKASTTAAVNGVLFESTSTGPATGIPPAFKSSAFDSASTSESELSSLSFFALFAAALVWTPRWGGSTRAFFVADSGSEAPVPAFRLGIWISRLSCQSQQIRGFTMTRRSFCKTF